MKRIDRVFPAIASLLFAALIVGCSEEATAPSSPEFFQVRGEPAAFTRCQRQPSASSSAWIGPEGGVLRAGNNVFQVPAGALHTRVLITMETTAGNINHVVFGPEGLVFNSQALPTLVMSYRHCSIVRGAQQGVAYVSHDLEVLEQTPSRNDPATRTVEARLSHFSDYVLLSTYAVVY